MHAFAALQFSAALEPQWRYPPIAAGGPWEPVSDCFALNVTDMYTWTCYDPGFAVIAIRDGTRTGLTGTDWYQLDTGQIPGREPRQSQTLAGRPT